MLRRYTIRLFSASLSPFLEFAFRFARTLLLSRLLSPTNLGAAVALSAILTGCEVITDIGLDKFVMVSIEGARAQVVAVARQVSVARAILLAAAIAILAPALADAFAAPGQRWLVAWLGIVPLIRSLKNWRIVQIQQDYSYGAEAISNIGGHFSAVLVVFPAYFLFHDARVMFASLVVEALVSVLLSYILAPAERVKSIDPAIRRGALTFGAPLMLNGVGLVASKQLDQMIVANLFGLATLALYSLAINLALLPTSVIQMIIGKTSQPFLGKARHDESTRRQALLIVIVASTLVAAIYAIPIGLVLDRLAPFVYGAGYKVSPSFSALAMLLAFLRLSRGGPNTVLIDRGQTGRLTAGNLIAVVGMVVGYLLGKATQSVEAVLFGLVLGDMLSIALFAWQLRHLLPIIPAIRHFVVLAATVGAAATGLWLDQGGWIVRALILAASSAVLLAEAAVIYFQIVLPFAGRSRRALPCAASPATR